MATGEMESNFVIISDLRIGNFSRYQNSQPNLKLSPLKSFSHSELYHNQAIHQMIATLTDHRPVSRLKHSTLTVR